MSGVTITGIEKTESLFKELTDAQVRKSDGGIKVSISPHTHYYIYDEFGTSKVKNNIGKLYRAIEGSKNECIDTAKELAKNYAK